jgi:DNA invertase Pin-like site-specific DNA recombinase
MTVACYLWSAAGPARGWLRDRARIQSWLDEQGIAPAEVEWYSDREAVDSPGRPSLGRLEQDIGSGKVTVVVIWKLSDLVTRLRALLAMLASWCERGVRVVAVSQRIDLGPEARASVVSVLRALGETELEFRRERQRRGIATAKARGVYAGRKRGTTKETPRRALALRGKGYTVAEIADALGVSERTAFRYLGSSRGSEKQVASKGAKS